MYFGKNAYKIGGNKKQQKATTATTTTTTKTTGCSMILDAFYQKWLHHALNQHLVQEDC